MLESYPLNYMTLNTGVYYLNDTDTPTEEVISHANIARRRAKETSTCVFEYNAELSSTEQKRAETIHSFQNALAKKEFQIYFQPKISGKTQEIASAEVLVRWLREDGTLWFPDSFLPILEETGEIESLDYYVYNAAFQWLVDRRENGLPLLPLSLNVSPIHSARSIRSHSGSHSCSIIIRFLRSTWFLRSQKQRTFITLMPSTR